jgi:hypothetical protein
MNFDWDVVFPNRTKVYTICAVLCSVSLAIIIFCANSLV